jgi:hypothetical protein
MKRYLATIILPVLLLSFSCKQKTVFTQEKSPQFNNQLTAEEKAGGVMTPELMWKFGRLGSIALSPDGSTVLYTVTDIDLQSEARRTNIFRVPVSGGVHLNGLIMANQSLSLIRMVILQLWTLKGR